MSSTTCETTVFLDYHEQKVSMVTSSWLQTHDTVFFLRHFLLIARLAPQGLLCNVIICPQHHLPAFLQHFTMFCRNAVVQKASVAGLHTSKVCRGFFIPTMNQCGVTVTLKRFSYLDAISSLFGCPHV